MKFLQNTPRITTRLKPTAIIVAYATISETCWKLFMNLDGKERIRQERKKSRLTKVRPKALR